MEAAPLVAAGRFYTIGDVMPDPTNVLISLHRGYGLGDAVQMSAVLRHVAKYRPHWTVDFRAEEGRHQVGRGLVANTFPYGEPYPPRTGGGDQYPSPHYDAEVQILLYDTWANWGDRPNTRVSSCLHERFDLGWDAECGRYHVEVSSRAMEMVKILTTPRYISYKNRKQSTQSRVVALHYQGDSSPGRKNLSHEQAAGIIKAIEGLDCTVLLLDWRDTSPLVDEYPVRSTGRLPMSKRWGGDAEMNCAVISQCDAFIGIDSGPSKCASATETPALVIWTGHHPAPFHDPADNTTHLVPLGYHGLEPVCHDRGVIDWFEEHYNVREYDTDTVGEVAAWLRETLK